MAPEREPPDLEALTTRPPQDVVVARLLKRARLKAGERLRSLRAQHPGLPDALTQAHVARALTLLRLLNEANDRERQRPVGQAYVSRIEHRTTPRGLSMRELEELAEVYDTPLAHLVDWQVTDLDQPKSMLTSTSALHAATRFRRAKPMVEPATFENAPQSASVDLAPYVRPVPVRLSRLLVDYGREYSPNWDRDVKRILGAVRRAVREPIPGQLRRTKLQVLYQIRRTLRARLATKPTIEFRVVLDAFIGRRGARHRTNIVVWVRITDNPLRVLAMMPEER